MKTGQFTLLSKVTGFYDHDNNPDTPYITAEADRYEVLYQGSPVASLSEPGKVEIAGAAAGTYKVTVRAYGGENTVRAEGVGSLTLGRSSGGGCGFFSLLPMLPA